MHIPDGFLSAPVCAATGAVSLGAVGYSVRRLKDSLSERTIPLTGMMSAMVFAGQMINFPIPGALVSGHLMGGVLAAVILGPWAGCVALTLVLVVQWALFADGGMLALGANILHMAVIGSLGGYALYSTIRNFLGRNARATVTGAVIASWFSVMAAAAMFCVEFGVSHAGQGYSFRNLFALMVAYHSLIGIGEALITGLAVSFVLAQRPDLIYEPKATRSIHQPISRTLAAGLVCALAIAAFLSPFASAFDDGLEAVAVKIGFDELESGKSLLLDDYEIPALTGDWQTFSVSAAGLLGTISVFVIALLLGRSITPSPSLAEAPRE